MSTIILKGQIVAYRKYNDQNTSWSEMILSEAGDVFYIRDYQTSFPTSLNISTMHIIGTLIEFESHGDFVTKVISIKEPQRCCESCSSIVQSYQDKTSFNAIREEFVKRITDGKFLLRPKSNSFDIAFDEDKYSLDTNFIFPSSYYELEFQTFFCKTCKAVFVVNNTERSSLYASISYLKYPFSIYKSKP